MNVVFGGTFDPPHRGHFEAAMDLRKLPGVDSLLIVPSYGTPLKNGLTDYEKRYEMASLAFPGLEVSRIEGELRSPFSWQLIEALSPSLPKMTFAIGTDQFVQIESWAEFPRVISLCNWIVLMRKPHRMDDFHDIIRKYCGQGWLEPTSNPQEFRAGKRIILWSETQAPDLSSTDIRKKLALGQIEDAKLHLHPKVFEFIERNHLYGI